MKCKKISIYCVKKVTDNKTKDPDTHIHMLTYVYVRGQIRQNFQGY